MVGRHGERGQTLLEFALAAPLVMVFLLGMVDFGIAVDRRLVLDHAVREGARFAAVGGQAFTTGSPATCAQIEAKTIAQAQNIINASQVQVTYINENGGGIGVGDTVRVRVSYTHDLVTGFADVLNTSVGSIVMTPSASARIERPPASSVGC